MVHARARPPSKKVWADPHSVCLRRCWGCGEEVDTNDECNVYQLSMERFDADELVGRWKHVSSKDCKRKAGVDQPAEYWNDDGDSRRAEEPTPDPEAFDFDAASDSSNRGSGYDDGDGVSHPHLWVWTSRPLGCGRISLTSPLSFR